MRHRSNAVAIIGGAAVLLLSGTAPLVAQTPDAGAAETTEESATPPMWRVTDADSEIFLLGTFHILPKGFQWRSKAVNEALEKAGTIWFEAEVDTPAAKQKTLQILMTQGFNDGGETLSKMLDPADAAHLRSIVQSIGLPFKAVDPMRPWQAFLAVSVQFVVSKGFDPNSGVETALLNEARTRGRTLKFFETVEQQLGLFTNLPPQAEKDLLVTTIREWEEQANDFGELFHAWAHGDTKAIDAMMNESLRDSAPEVFDVLVTRRNIAWANQIAEEMAGSGTELVAVGAGHLVGEGSVPALLRAKGFNVERIVESNEDPAPPPPAANDNAPEKASDDAIGDLLQGLDRDPPQPQ